MIAQCNKLEIISYKIILSFIKVLIKFYILENILYC